MTNWKYSIRGMYKPSSTRYGPRNWMYGGVYALNTHKLKVSDYYFVIGIL